MTECAVICGANSFRQMIKNMRNQSARPSYVVIGTSAGGVVALSRVFKDIPASFPGAILVVFHVHGAGR